MTPQDSSQGASTDMHRCIVIPMQCRSVACTEASRRSQQLLYRMAHVNNWYASAFTQGNDLPWNAQTLFGCQCA
jgi:hypothetical protein